MIYVTINDKKLQIPNQWGEVPFKQYIKYTKIKKPQFIDAVAIFTGIPRKTWEDSKEIQNFYIIVNALKFLEKEPSIKKVTNPGAVTITRRIDGKDVAEEYDVPQNLEKYTVKQFEDMRGLIRMEQKKKDITVSLYPKIVSIYFCTLIFGSYTVANIKKTEPLIEELTIFEVAGIGNFFLKSFIVLSNGTRKERRLLPMIGRKLRRAFIG